MRKILLVLLFMISVFGSDNKEIGIPQKPISYDNSFNSKIKSATFSLDGNNMYTYINGLVTIYETNPMKKVSSFHIKPDKSLNYGYRRQKIFVTKDKKRIIFYSPEYIQLWDIKTKKLLKKILLLSTNSAYYSDGLIVLTDKSFIEILDDTYLKVMRRSTSPYIIKDIPHYDDQPFEILVNNNIVLLRFMRWGMFLDLKTLKIIDQTAYDTNVMKYVKKYKQDFSPDLKKLLKQESTYRPCYVYSFKLSNKQTILYTFVSASKFFIKKYKNVEKNFLNRYVFLQNDDDWLLYDIETHTFTGSKNIQKYLKMKTEDGKVVPINDATFNKYNKTINLKD